MILCFCESFSPLEKRTLQTFQFRLFVPKCGGYVLAKAFDMDHSIGDFASV